MENDQVISISVEVNALPEKVWEYWTNPEHIVNWNFASDQWCCPSAVNVVKVGEQFSWRMEAKDGNMGFDFEGTYTKVNRPLLLEYKLGDGRPVSVEFEPNGSSTIIKETFQGEDTNALEMQRHGWLSILENYKKYLEG